MRAEGQGLATIVNRRLAPAPGPAPARGPGAALSSLTLLGWVSAIAAVGYLAISLRPILDLGGPSVWDWGEVGNRVLAALRPAAVVGMPAALELGVPGARRRTPWLMRGLVLLALEELARPAIRVAEQYVYEQIGPESMELAFGSPLGLALAMVSIGATLLAVGGAWALSDGLADAGARPRRVFLAVVVGIGLVLSLFAYLPAYGYFVEGATFDLALPRTWFNAVGVVLGFVEIWLWLVIGTRLVAGSAARLRPRRAWILGAIAGVTILVVRLGYPLLFIAQPDIPGLAFAAGVVASVPWLVLFLAFAAGLGRGRERRDERPRRLRLYVLNPTD